MRVTWYDQKLLNRPGGEIVLSTAVIFFGHFGGSLQKKLLRNLKMHLSRQLKDAFRDGEERDGGKSGYPKIFVLHFSYGLCCSTL